MMDVTMVTDVPSQIHVYNIFRTTFHILINFALAFDMWSA